eukprot:1356220-Pyramimonas_sp.AAC.1
MERGRRGRSEGVRRQLRRPREESLESPRNGLGPPTASSPTPLLILIPGHLVRGRANARDRHRSDSRGLAQLDHVKLLANASHALHLDIIMDLVLGLLPVALQILQVIGADA